MESNPRLLRPASRPLSACIVALLGLAAFVGCRGGESTAAAPIGPVGAPPAASGTSSVRGRVVWEGAIPERREIDISGNPDIARVRTTPLLSDDLVVGPDRGVESVLLFVDLPADPSARMPAPARMECRGGRYVPHLLAVEAGQTVEFVQTDPTLLNVHLIPRLNPEDNFAIPVPGKRPRAFALAEPEFVRVKADVHPWMSAFIAVLPHSCSAVTGEDGRYEIVGVPPGRHTLVMRHPKLPEQRVELDFPAGGNVERGFTLRR